MKKYFAFWIFFFLSTSLVSQTVDPEYTEKEFALPDGNYPIVVGANNTYTASESIKFLNGYHYNARSTNKIFKAKIDLNLIFDVEIENGYTGGNIFSPTNGRPLDDSKEVGKIPASYSVDNVGGFNYFIPIQVPPGSNGVAPEISIVYSSNFPTGTLGLGWNISGLSSISRTSKVNYFDDITEPLQLDDTDPFILDGQRLIKDGSIYRTESENYAVVTPYNITADGPERWEVISKNGAIIEYGNGSNSKIAYGTKIISWLIYKVTNLNGNYIEYKYREENGQKLIDEILYTGNASNEPYNKVKFTYVEKQEGVKRFYKGFESNDNYLVDKIITYSHNTPIYEYSMSYNYGVHNYVNSSNQSSSFVYERPFLKDVKLKSLLGGEELHSTIFEYGDDEQTKAYTTNISSLALINKTAVFNLGDFNGDGITDVAEFGLVGNNLNAYANIITYKQNNGDGSFASYISSQPLTKSRPIDLTKHWDAFNKVIRSTDLNGDGEDDFLISQVNIGVYPNSPPDNIEIKAIVNKTVSGNNVIKFITTNPDDFAISTGDFTGDGVQDGIGYDKVGNSLMLENYESETSYSLTSPVPSFENLTAIDYDGDGTIELLLWTYDGSQNKIKYTVVDIRKSLGTYSLHNLGGGMQLGGVVAYDKIQVGDFNGDGVSDLCLIPKGNSTAIPKVFVGNGNGVYTDLLLSIIHNPNDTWSFVDINNDGFSDLLRIYEINTTTTGVEVLYSNGNSAFSYNYPNIPYKKSELSNFSFGDFDGDNSLELFFVRYQYSTVYPYDYSYNPTLFKFSGGPIINKLSGIRNGLNQDLKLEYTYNSNPAEKYDYTYNPEGTYQNGYITQDIQLTDGNEFLDKQVLLTKKIEKSLAVAGNNYNYYGITEKFIYSSAIFNKEGKGLIGMGLKSVSMPYQGKRVNSNYKFDNTCNCLLPKKTLVYEDTDDNPDIYEETEMTYSVSSLQGGARYLIQQTKTEYENFITGVDKTTDISYYPSGNLMKTITNDGIYSNSMEIKSYGQFGTAIPIHPTEIETIKNNLTETGSSIVSTELDYFANGNLKEKINYAGTAKEVKSQFTYDDYGNVLSNTISSAGLPTLVSTSLFDEYGQFAKWIENSKGQKTHFEIWKPFGLPKSIKTADNNFSYFAYNGFGRKVSETGPDGNTTDIEVDWNTTPNQLPGGGPAVFSNASLYYVKTNNPGFSETKEVFDYLERSVSKEIDGWEDKIYSTTEYYFEEGKEISLVKKRSVPQYANDAGLPKYIEFEYDKLQRITDINYPYISTNQTISYSAVPLTSAYYEVTTTSSDGQARIKKSNGAGEVVAVVDDGGELTYTYNNLGLPKEINLNSQFISSFEYDIDGTQTKLIDINAGTTNYLYDAYGNLIEQSDAKGVTSLIYNNFNELDFKINPLGTIDYDYVDNGNGLNQIQKITHTNGTEETIQYDKLGRNIQYDKVIDNETYTYQYSYDIYGRQQTMKYPSGFTILSEYSAEGFLKKIKNLADASIIWEGVKMNEKGQYTEVNKGNDLTTKYTYTKLGLLEETEGELDFSFSFETKSGNLSDWTDNTNTLIEDFEYDGLNRLTKMTLNGSVDQVIDYQSNGNIVKKGAITNYKYHVNKKNAVVSVEDHSALMPAIEQNIVYNALNQPASISEGSHLLELTYGSNGQRIQTKLKESGTLLRTRTYLPNYEIQEFSADDRLQQIHYIAGGDGLAAIYVIEDGVGSMYTAHTNHLGSILKLIDETGNTVVEQSFDAWGRRRNATDWTYSNIASIPDWLYRGYTGHEHYEEFDLINMNGRMYDPLLGRMLSADNYIQDNTSTQNYNRYSYVLNNPLKYTDPSGEYFGIDDAIAAAIGGVINLGVNIFNGNLSGMSFSETFVKGFAAFGAGAVSGTLALYGPAGWAAGGAITGATNAWLSGADSYGQIAQSAAIGAFSGVVGGSVGQYAVNGIGSVAINGFSITSPVVKGIAAGAIGGGAAGYSGGFVAGYLYTGDLGLANQAGLNGLYAGFAIGAASGGISAYAAAKNTGRDPWRGNFSEKRIREAFDIPEGWEAGDPNGGKGIKFTDPHNPHNFLRFMEPKINGNSWQKNHYLQIKLNGNSIDVNGNILPNQKVEPAHIPIDKINVNNPPWLR